MPRTLLNVETGQPEEVGNDAAAEQAILAGTHQFYEAGDIGERVAVIRPDGRPSVIPLSSAKEALEHGYKLEPLEETSARQTDAELEAEYADAPITAGALGLARGATFGLSDMVLSALPGDQSEFLRETRNRNAGASTVGELVGAVAPSLLTGGAGSAGALARATPAGKVAGWGGSILKLGEGAGFARGVGAAALSGAVEGGIYGAGSFITDVALENKPLSAEAFVGSMGHGAWWGAGLGGAFAAAGRGFRRVGEWRSARAAAAEEAASAAVEAKAVAQAEKRALSQEAKKEIISFRAEEARKTEAIKQVGRLEMQGARNAAVETRAGAQKAVAEARLGTAEARAGAQKATAESRLGVAQERSRVRLGAEASRTEREILKGEYKLETARTYTQGWRDVNESKLIQRRVTSDAMTRTEGMRQAGKVGDYITVKQLIPEHQLRTGAPEAVLAQADEAVSGMLQKGDDLLPHLDTLAAGTGDPAIVNARDQLARVLDDAAEMAAKPVDDIVESTAVIGQSEKAVNDALDAMEPYLDDASKAAIQTPEREAFKAAQAKEGGKWGALADAAAYAELAQTLGIPGVPDIDQLPIIGPALGLYLKARALFRVGERVGIKVPGSPLAAVAQKSAQFQNRIGTSIKAFGRGISAAGKVAVPTTAQILSSPLVREGRNVVAGKTAQNLFEKRAEELFLANSNPDRFRRQIREQVATGDPDVDKAVEETVIRKAAYQYKTMPKDPRDPEVLPLGARKWQPSPSALSRWARIVRATENPDTVIKDMAAGSLTMESVEAMKAVYPELYQHVQKEIVHDIANLQATLPYSKRVQLSVFFDLPVDDTMRPEFIGAMQAGYAKQAQPPQPPTGMDPSVNLSQQEQLGAHRRAAR